MEHWEFLLQKDGDRSWLPLDSPSVEILEGRYRIVVRSSQPNTEVVVRISHLNTEVEPPTRRLQKRSSRTNQDGLMVLIPYTCLEPGIWGFHCSCADLMSELAGVPWQYSVQLQVLGQETEAEEWEPDWLENAVEAAPSESSSIAPAVSTPPENLADAALTSQSEPSRQAPVQSDPIELPPPEAALQALPATSFSREPLAAPLNPVKLVHESPSNPDSDPAAEELRYLTEQLSDELIDEVMQEFDLLDLPEPFLRSTLNLSGDLSGSASSSGQRPDALQQPALCLIFDQDAFVARESETLTLTGTLQGQRGGDRGVIVPDPWDSVGNSPQARSLQLYLRDPQSLEVLVSDRQSLSATAQRFSLSFSLPAPLDTRLILGEVQLLGSENGDEPQVLATQTFTITVNPLDLVQELTRINTALKQPKPEASESPRLPQEQQSVFLDLSFLASAAPPSPPQKSFALGGQPLPPQIYHPASAQGRSSALHLPDFASTPDPAQPDSIVPAPHQASQSVPSSPEAEMPTDSKAIVEVGETLELDESPDQPSLIASGVTAAEPTTQPDESIPATAPEQVGAEDSLEVAPEDVPVENSSFRALNLHDRFLTRLNALADSGDQPKPDALTWVSPASSSEEFERMAEEVVNDEAAARSRSRGKPTDAAEAADEASPNL